MCVLGSTDERAWAPKLAMRRRLSVGFCPLCAFYDHATLTQEGLSCL